jgi:predicted RNase H-like HicB family nuclease
MLYPAYVHIGDDQHAHGVTVPDFPGCVSAADAWQDLPRAVQEAVEAHCAGAEEQIPEPTPLEKLAKDPDYSGGAWMLFDIDLSRINARAVRLNISLPERLLLRIDAEAQRRKLSRSAFLALAAEREMNAA